MHNVLLFVPEQLKMQIQQTAARSRLPMRSLYLQAMASFIDKADQVLRAGALPAVTFHATLRSEHAARFQMWLEAPMAADVHRLAAAASVSRRAFCYSALLDTFKIPGEHL